ncbi:MAG: hypothetical protein KDD63_21415, partial [Bacteroidetes bacterium]|nr:hypothetical protein [Bacteroidota bacterium]
DKVIFLKDGKLVYYGNAFPDGVSYFIQHEAPEIAGADAVMETLEFALKEDVIIEVNTRGTYKKATNLYPSPWILKEIHRMGIKIMLNSDSHHPREIRHFFPEAAKILLDIGFDQLWVLWDKQWQPFPFDENGVLI